MKFNLRPLIDCLAQGAGREWIPLGDPDLEARRRAILALGVEEFPDDLALIAAPILVLAVDEDAKLRSTAYKSLICAAR